MRDIVDLITELYRHPDYVNGIIFTLDDVVDRLNEQIDYEGIIIKKEDLGVGDLKDIQDSIQGTINWMTQDIDPYPQLDEMRIGAKIQEQIERDKHLEALLNEEEDEEFMANID